VRNGAPRSVAKGRRVMTNEATPAILNFILHIELLYNYFYNFTVLLYKHYKVIIYVEQYKHSFAFVKRKV